MKGRSGSGEEFRALVRHEARWRNGLGSLRVLLAGRSPKNWVGWLRFIDPHPMRLWRPKRKPSVATSLLLHFAVLLFLLRMPWGMLSQQSHVKLPLIHADYQIIYPLPRHKVQIHSRPKSAEKAHKVKEVAKPKPHEGAKRAAGAGLKKPSPAPKFTLVLKPPHADNHEQTIIQAGTPPDLRIHHYVPLPNVLLSGVANKTNPKMPTAGPAPKANPAAGAAAMNVPKPVIPEMALAVQIPRKQPPLLASPEVALPLPAQEQALGSIYATKRKGSGSNKSRGLLVLGANPTPPGKLMSIPLGNRYGAFSVSLLGGKSGVPSGPGGPAMGAGGKAAGNGGDTVSGDVGGAANGSAAVAAFGPSSNGSGSSEGILPPWMAKNLVYPVARAAKTPAIHLIVTAGPIGGGGLGAFGVLSCSRIYTIYLSMPGKPWVLQYCRKQKAATSAPASKADPSSGTVHFGAGITPPWALQKFDFHRPPVSEYKRDRMIVLQGVISKDGAVKNLKVYQGVGSIADQAALAAFERWKFHPATAPNGKPTAVEMLVGIPATVPK